MLLQLYTSNGSGIQQQRSILSSVHLAVSIFAILAKIGS